MSDDNVYRLGYDKDGDPVTFYPDGCYAARHATNAILCRLNKQHAEITRLRERCETLEDLCDRCANGVRTVRPEDYQYDEETPITRPAYMVKTEDGHYLVIADGEKIPPLYDGDIKVEYSDEEFAMAILLELEVARGRRLTPPTKEPDHAD